MRCINKGNDDLVQMLLGIPVITTGRGPRPPSAHVNSKYTRNVVMLSVIRHIKKFNYLRVIFHLLNIYVFKMKIISISILKICSYPRELAKSKNNFPSNRRELGCSGYRKILIFLANWRNKIEKVAQFREYLNFPLHISNK